MSIKDWKDICFESNLIKTLHFINIHYVNHGGAHIVAWIQLITKFIDIVFGISGPIYFSTIWIPTQICSNLVMAECTTFLENL